MFRLTSVLTAFLLISNYLTGQEIPDYNKTYDILIYNGIVIDGTGSPGKKGDVLISGENIAFIGSVNINRIKVKEKINADGKIITPGFIDTHAHGNPIRTPEFKNFIGMGVTTIFIGQDGSSPSNISEWMKRVEEVEPAINIATLIGHGTMRKKAGIQIDQQPKQEDLKRMADLINEAMKAGCFGLSTGIEYQPGCFAKQEELNAIAQPVGKLGGIVQSHIRSEDDNLIQNALSELFTQGKEGKCAVQITHMKVVYGKGKKRAEEILSFIEKTRRNGVTINADMYPYTASYTGIGIVFPDWAKPPNDYQQVKTNRRKELAGYLRERVNFRNGPEATLIGSGEWAGKTLKQISVELDKPFEDVLIDDFGPRGVSAAYFVMDQELQDRLFLDPHVMVCTDGSPTMRHPRGYGSFAKVIRYYVREKKLLKLEEAVHKMTGLSAATMGLLKQNRGILRTGFAADILVFDSEKIQDKATYENPHQIAEGFEWVIVNGIPARANGNFTGKKGGKMLRKNITR